MRFLKFFVPVFVVLSIVIVSNQAYALAVNEINKGDITNPINKKTEEENKKSIEDRKMMSQQLLTSQVASDAEAKKNVTAGNINDSARSQQESMVDTFKRTNELDTYLCSWASQSGIGRAAAAAAQAKKMLLEERLKVTAGTVKSENGLVDFQNKLFDEMQGLGDQRFSVGHLLNTSTIPTSGAIASQLNYTQDLLYARVPVYLNQDLLDNADTEVKNLSIQADRLRAEMGIGQTVFSTLQGNRAPAGGPSVPWIKEIMTENEFPNEYISELLPGDASLRAQMEGMAVGQFGRKYMVEKFAATPELIPIGILYNSMLTNFILFKQYELLEGIAASTATNVIATREEAIKDVNARISRKNARQ